MRCDLKHLTTFVAVAEELNFHRAAERLSMAQPAVSRIVLEMEERMGAKLLERTTRKVRLTESGRYLLEEAQEILRRVDVAESTVRLLASGTKARLRVGYTTITGHSLVPDIAREFRITNPEVQLELTYLTSPAQRDKILQGEIDLGFIEGAFQSSEIESHPVARHKLVALLPPENRKIRFYVPEPRLAGLALGARLALSCDGCPPDMTAKVSFLSKETEFTPPVIFSDAERAKLVFKAEARFEGAAPALPLGLPVTVRPAP